MDQKFAQSEKNAPKVKKCAQTAKSRPICSHRLCTFRGISKTGRLRRRLAVTCSAWRMGAQLQDRKKLGTVGNRVTGLGEIWPLRWSLTFGIFLGKLRKWH
jgi:hypothetical protein